MLLAAADPLVAQEVGHIADLDPPGMSVPAARVDENRLSLSQGLRVSIVRLLTYVSRFKVPLMSRVTVRPERRQT